MAEDGVHCYNTVWINPDDLTSSNTLVGECGGLSSIVGDVERSNVFKDLVRVETEHGPLYLDPDEPAECLAEDP